MTQIYLPKYLHCKWPFKMRPTVRVVHVCAYLCLAQKVCQDLVRSCSCERLCGVTVQQFIDSEICRAWFNVSQSLSSRATLNCI